MDCFAKASLLAEEGHIEEAKALYQTLLSDFVWKDKSQYAIALLDLSLGNLRSAALSLITLYASTFQQDAIFSLLQEVFFLPNEAMLSAIYQKNQALLDEEYPQYPLPKTAEALPYQLFPIDEDFFILFHCDQNKFLSAHFTAAELFILQMFSEEWTEAPLGKENVLQEISHSCKEKATELFQTLQACLQDKQSPLCNEQLLSKIALYHTLSPYDRWDQYFYGKYYFLLGDFDQAEAYTKASLKYNRYNVDKLLLLLSIYQKNGNLIDEGRLLQNLKFTHQFPMDMQKILALYAQYITKVFYTAPELIPEIFCYSPESVHFPMYHEFYIEDNTLKENIMLFYGRFLPKVSQTEREWNDFVGIRAENPLAEELSFRAAKSSTHDRYCHLHVNTEIQKAKQGTSFSISEVPAVVPISALQKNQKIQIENSKGVAALPVDLYAFRHFRIEEPCTISSDADMILGKPVLLKHAPNRKKLVLHIFLDAVSYRFLHEQSFACCPNMLRFFQKGIIFTENYTVAEYTQPVYASQHTGVYSKTHQYFNRPHMFFSKSLITVPEVFQKAGYYTSAFSSETQQVLTDGLRGFDKSYLKWGHTYPIQEQVADTIAHLKAYPDCDHFVWFANSDAHRVLEPVVNQISSQTTTPYYNAYRTPFHKEFAGIFQTMSTTSIHDYQELLSIIDMQLGLLFSFLEETYKEEEYIVCVSSDHGASTLTDDSYLLKDIHTNTLLMLRGANVPKLGFVTDELTSILDFYPSMFSLANIPIGDRHIDGVLPKALGGPGREYTITESRFPGQTYKLCIRTMEYEYRFETAAFTSYEGKPDLEKFSAALYHRRTNLPAGDAAAEKYFSKLAYRYLRDFQIHM